MAQDNITEDPWQHAGELAERLLVIPNGNRDIGSCRYEREANNPGYIRFWGSDASGPIESSVGFSSLSSYAREKPHLIKIAYFENGKWHSWISGKIAQTSNAADKNYPTFDYHWKLDNNQDVPTLKLSFLRVDPVGGMFVNYEPPSWQSRVPRNKVLPNGMPSSIKGLDELLGQAIPWEIDYAQAAQKFLDKAHLEEFVNAATEYQRN